MDTASAECPLYSLLSALLCVPAGKPLRVASKLNFQNLAAELSRELAALDEPVPAVEGVA